jgi:thiol-disulfide isomerase/thioredoxin
MKKIFLAFIAIALLAAKPAVKEVKWLTNLEKAKKLSKKEHKPILLYFTGSDWCAPCKGLEDNVFTTERFEYYADNYVLVKVDIPRATDIISEKQLKYNKKLLRIYNKDEHFYYLLVLNHKGQKLGKMKGYYMKYDYYFSFFDKMLKSYNK